VAVQMLRAGQAWLRMIWVDVTVVGLGLNDHDVQHLQLSSHGLYALINFLKYDIQKIRMLDCVILVLSNHFSIVSFQHD